MASTAPTGHTAISYNYILVISVICTFSYEIVHQNYLWNYIINKSIPVADISLMSDVDH